ncbi:hypothetical protein LTR53_010400 [Teratosphaeriaceae sp. CCFEE 6253]|nr:hypothetical protein LTR53_010400 [Teratosphaeriaceae sp. CCFEE 6253]
MTSSSDDEVQPFPLQAFYHDNLSTRKQAAVLLDREYRQSWDWLGHVVEARNWLSHREVPLQDTQKKQVCMGMIGRSCSRLREQLAERAMALLADAEG